MSIGTLHVKVISARNLRIADLGGLSDPFVVLRLAPPATTFAKLDSAPEFGTTKVIQKVHI
jgi:Ca2+-dependent lipid-binding protein